MTKISNYLKSFKFLAVIFSFSLLAFTLAAPVFAVVLYLEPSEGQYYQGDTFIINLKIDVEEECINTVKADLIFSQDALEAVDFSRGKSILTLWLEEPKINREKGIISFIAGIPGGYCGVIPGDIGESNLLGKIIFQAKEISGEQFSAEIKFLDDSQVLLNDGLGTPAELKTKEANFMVLSGKGEVPIEEWKEKLEKDNIPPEPFEIKITRDPDIFDGKYFIVFHTTDKQTGIDYYEIKEGKADWQRGESPYLLRDQKLTGIIKVRAVDKAGNERTAEWRPERKEFPWFIIILLIGILSWWILKNKRLNIKK